MKRKAAFPSAFREQDQPQDTEAGALFWSDCLSVGLDCDVTQWVSEKSPPSVLCCANSVLAAKWLYILLYFFFCRAYFRKVVYQSGKCCEHDVIIMVPYASWLLTNHPCFSHLVDFKSMIKNLILLMLTLDLYQCTSMLYTGKKIFVSQPLRSFKGS